MKSVQPYCLNKSHTGGAGTANLIALLKRCTSLTQLQNLHLHLAQSGHLSNVFVSTTLLHMYIKCNHLHLADQLFHEMHHKNAVSWNCLILGYVDNGKEELALELYNAMISATSNRYFPNHVTFLAALKAVISLANKERSKTLVIQHGHRWRSDCLRKGKTVHSHAARNGDDSHIFVANALVDMYSSCGEMVSATNVFESIECPSVVSWTEVILGHADAGEAGLALELYARMGREGICQPDGVTLVAVLKACVSLAEMEETRVQVVQTGKTIHSQAVRGGEQDVFVVNALVDMYFKYGRLLEARIVFESAPNTDVVTWNSVVLGYAENGDGDKALEVFGDMEEEGVEMNYITFLAALKACVSLAEKETVRGGKKVASLRKGRAVHSLAADRGLEGHVYVQNSLLDVYTRCRSMSEARRVFDSMVHKDLLAWSVIILGYAENHQGMVALELYARMNEEGLEPNEITHLAALKACVGLAEEEQGREVKTNALERGRAVHVHILRTCRERPNVFITSALVDMYSKCRSLSDARRVFDGMAERNTVSWNSMIQGCVDNGEPSEALRLHQRMKELGFSPDAITYVAALHACECLGLVETGRDVEAELRRVKLGADDTKMVENSLVDFYGKCGCMRDAERVFESMARRDVVSWNALIDGYSRDGDYARALEVFEALRRQEECGVQPNEVSFLVVLTLCSHAGMVEKGKEYFQLMVSEYGCVPEEKHYTCVVDLLGRANRLEEAMEMVQSMPCEPGSVTWTSLLASSRNKTL